MASKWRHERHSGLKEVEFNFGLHPKERPALSALLNQACRVLLMHAGGNLKALYTDEYASRLASYIEAHPGLTHRLLRSDEWAIQTITYRALEMLGYPPVASNRKRRGQ